MSEFVGGILLKDQNQVLLVGRSTADADMPGLWSLPAGEINDGDTSHEAALEREFKEETNQDIKVGPWRTRVTRVGWQVDIFAASKASEQELASNDSDISRLQYFDLRGGLPERIVLEALIGILRYAYPPDTRVKLGDYSHSVDALFSSVYYSYLQRELATSDQRASIQLLEWEISKTPWRKFKSAIPLLLAGSCKKMKPYAIIAELMFAAWTVADDLCDRRSSRYGQPTAISKLGHQQVSAATFGLVEEIASFAHRSIDEATARLVRNSMRSCAAAQLERLRVHHTSTDRYLRDASQRSQFLGDMWTHALRACGFDKEASLIASIYPACARVGQLANDYRDIHGPGRYRDIRNEVSSYYVTALRQHLGERDSRPVFRLSPEQLDKAISAAGIENMMKAEAVREVRNIYSAISSSTLSQDRKAVLTAWVYMQLASPLAATEKPPVPPSVSNLVEAVDSLTRKLE